MLSRLHDKKNLFENPELSPNCFHGPSAALHNAGKIDLKITSSSVASKISSKKSNSILIVFLLNFCFIY